MQFHSLAAADSAAAWLMRHGRHVHKLLLEGRAAGDESADSCALAVATCLSMPGMAPQLADLSIDAGCNLHTEWLCPMRSLQRLSLTADYGTIHIAPATSGLTVLQSLELCSNTLQLPAACRLPTSITRLSVCFFEMAMWPEMPQQASSGGHHVRFQGMQVDLQPPADLLLWTSHAIPTCLQFAQLPQLQRLKFDMCDCSADSMSRLSALSSSLTRLEVSNGPLTAPQLAMLTRLQHFCWLTGHADSSAVASSALPHLTGLTCLVSPLGG